MKNIVSINWSPNRKPIKPILTKGYTCLNHNCDSMHWRTKKQNTKSDALIFMITIFILLSSNADSQDNIIRITGEEIYAKVIEIDHQKVQYKTDNSARFFIPTKDVFMIQYKNGATDVFRDGSITSSTEPKIKTESTQTQKAPIVTQAVPPIKAEPAVKTKPSEVKFQVVASEINMSNDEVLTNESIITLFKKGFSTTLILGKIKRTPSDFDLSMDALLKLKEMKIPNEIIDAIEETGNETQRVLLKAESEKGVAVADAVSVQESGIYYQKNVNGQMEMKELEPSVSAKSVTDSGWGASYTYGAMSTKTRARFDGIMARFRINESRPVFFFYFDQGSSLSNANAWFAPSSSPNEFLLVKMTTVKKSREFITGSSNRWAGSEWGVEEKSRVPFTIEKIKPGVYKVTPNYTLQSGEYCFMYAGNASHYGITGQKVFDFGVN